MPAVLFQVASLAGCHSVAGRFRAHADNTPWQTIDTLVEQIPFTKTKVENVVMTQLNVKDTSQSPFPNTAFQFYMGGPIPLSNGMLISKVDLRIRHKPGHPGFLVLNLDVTCTELAEVRAHYSDLRVTDRPRGISLDEVTSYSTELQWGKLSFSFKERNPKCLSSVAFKPTLIETGSVGE
ncbi:hypothetical protein LJ656_33250 [Paraburkholderia sp. MMS20-SJTR3]|uniref:Uncharacterized protein n=1 Tax=Paraburkholderia sejongensis TaxID=2886946 RepID=A0ABS8K5K5_9BURK|nr:hypothetical protein [Paraburkholderia sp. MMS20-SJTR3]MCC8397432.1 hypothetical protein [Paraburkholderia sp. MMS20-SJTR3]